MESPTDDEDQGRILLDVALQFGATLDLDHLLPLVLERVTTLLHADRAAFALLDGEGNVQRAVVHNLAWAGPGHPLPLSQGLVQEVLTTRQPVVVADAASDADFQARESVRLLGLRFMMGVPITAHGGGIVGVLYVDSKASKVKDLNEETRLLDALGRLVGTAVENARLFEEQRYRTRLLATLVHDFLTPLSVILANAEMLSWLADPLEAEEMARDIAASARRMSAMVDNTLELSRMDTEAREVKPEHLDLESALQKHIRGLEVVAGPLELRFELDVDPGLPPVPTVPDRLWIILDNLLFNALKHARSGTAVRVAVTLRSDAGPADEVARPQEGVDIMARLRPLRPRPGAAFVEISIHNEGPAIPGPLLNSLFRPYVRGSAETRGHRSTGLGLSIVDQCARHLGGAVWARSGEDVGTRFTFTLPTALRDEEEAPEPQTIDAHDTLPLPLIPPRD